MSPSHNALRTSLNHRLQSARASTDALFAMLSPDALTARPIPERHRVIFYLGHLEAFDWNLLGRTTAGLEPFNAYFDDLFAFGIDPVDGNLPSDVPSDWPPVPDILAYTRRARETADDLLARADFGQSEDLYNGLVFEVAIEHRLMHAETLSYMLHRLPIESKAPPHRLAAPKPSRDTSPEQTVIPEGPATLGQQRGNGFGWDNEFNKVVVPVDEFGIDRFNITNGQFLAFVQVGGYEEPSLWSAEDWDWKREEGVCHPVFWERHGDAWMLRNMFEVRPLPLDCPVYVSHAEARAYARWADRDLPTEAQLHRAAYGTSEGPERAFPWGDDTPGPEHGNFDLRGWDAAPVGCFPAGDSAFGVADLVGNGWEWTSTVFQPLDGFRRFHFYPGYSADFFDGKHFVLKGGSPRTAASMVRRSFRNWFQPHYPYIYAAFRTVEA